MANIRDIAKMAGVSVTTVSRVLNEHPYVSEEKRQKVLTAMEQANYQKNMHAVHLSRGQSYQIGVVVPFANHPYFGALLEGITKQAVQNHYHLVLIQTNYEEIREREALEMLRYKQVDGLIICSRISDWNQIKDYADDGTIVVCEDAREKPFVHSVFIDHYESFQQALRYLYQRGHSRTGYCIGRKSGSNSYYRDKAYRDFLQSKGIVYDSSLVFFGNYYFEDGHEVVDAIQKMADPPTALLVTNDILAAGVLTACQDAGIQVPDQMAIVGFDNQPIAKMMHLTTFEIPLKEMGEHLFLQTMNEKQGIYKEFQASLIERKTV
ncbi:LacI family transcriptional regulator [Gracilibacillus halophilus YIM-C55.5]|uniref:LacI family transcriptional regulator n=1 Tax=Gracilibacillus halophilus YIM-C55.5 TaxID=1308866 RepID=N4WRH5_9BACI|nr:LacI family DNA-binding transcriptional regulator [Gracilibacillus halophilus]ENH95816.1 LacI family transcriptional regulator [Gracilibacillus halophilus YIM-C55.5]